LSVPASTSGKSSKKPTLAEVVARFGKTAKSELSNPSAVGEPEDQLRAPFEQLLADLAAFMGYAPGAVVAAGETSLSELRTRPDYAVTTHGALVGFVEIKAPLDLLNVLGLLVEMEPEQATAALDAVDGA
jgi:hypothetical protein